MGVSSSPTHHSTHSNLQPASTMWMNLLSCHWLVLNPRDTFESSLLLKSERQLTMLTISLKYLKYDFHNSSFSWFLNFLRTEMNSGFNQDSVYNNSRLFLLYSPYQVNLIYLHSIIIMPANNLKINTFTSKFFLDFLTKQYIKILRFSPQKISALSTSVCLS